MYISIHQDNILNDTCHLLKTSYYYYPLHFEALIANLHNILALIFHLPHTSALHSHQFISHQPTGLGVLLWCLLKTSFPLQTLFLSSETVWTPSLILPPTFSDWISQVPWNLSQQLSLCNKDRNDQLRVAELNVFTLRALFLPCQETMPVWVMTWRLIHTAVPGLGHMSSSPEDWRIQSASAAHLHLSSTENTVCANESWSPNAEKQGWVLRVLIWDTNLTEDQ